MPSSYELLRSRERLRVAGRFLTLRPRIVLVGALCNGVCLASSGAPPRQKLMIGGVFAAAVGAFFLEAHWLTRRELSEGWLLGSLSATLLGLSAGALASGGLASPFLPLFFAPVVVGLAAFGRVRESAALLGLAGLALAAVGLAPGAPELPAPWSHAMLAISGVVSFALLAVGVISLVDAHARVAAALEELRERALAEAEQRAASVERLGAVAAHELKNPLTAVRGLLQLVARKTEDPKQRERLAVAEQEVDRVLESLAGYLSFTRPIAALEREPVDVLCLLEEVSTLLEARAHERGVAITVRGERATEQLDLRRMRDAILNLALNALDATPRGGHLELELCRRASGLSLVVRDDGAGVPPEVAARWGEPFASGRERGNGLGVLIAKGIVEQHGGALSVASARGEGTEVTIELPAGPAPGAS